MVRLSEDGNKSGEMSTGSRTAGSPCLPRLVHVLRGDFGRITQRCFISVDTQIHGAVAA